MKRLKLPLLIYILISQPILSSAKYIENGILSQYPYRKHLEFLLEEYDKLNDGSIYSMLLNMDPQTLKSIGEDIATIVQLGGKGIDSVVNVGKSLYSGIKSLGEYSKNALFFTIDTLKNYYPAFIAAASVAALVKYQIDDLNKYNDKIVVEIQKLISDRKYKGIIENNIGKDLENIIEKGISKLDLKKHIKDFLNKENLLEKLDYKFNETIDSLNFILLGDTGAGKSTFLNKILELNPEDTGAYVNPDFAGPTTKEFKKYRNEIKKGIELIDSRGIESNENYNAKYFMGNFTNYFDIIRNENNSNFIYGILFICETESFSEIDILKYLKNISNNKIPLKLLYTKGKDDSQTKRINNTIKLNFDDIKPYFLKTTSNGDYEKNLNDFLKDLFEELNETKLKDIYQYYYTLDIFNNYQFIMKKINVERKILIHSVKKKIDPIDNIINNLEFDLKFFLLNPDINRENIKNDVKEIYKSFVNKLNEDFKNMKYADYPLKEYENRNMFDKLKEYLTSNPLPSDIIAHVVSQMINDFILNLFLITVKKEYFKNPIQVGNYPDFASIKNAMEKNFIKIQDKKNTKESNPYSFDLTYILIAIIIVLLILFYKCFCQKKERKEIKEEKREIIDLNESDEL